MTRALPTKLRLSMFSSVLPLLLLGCIPTSGKVAAPPPQSNEVARALCLTWQRTAATWEDGDTEATKDSVDLSIRAQESACRDYGPV